MKVEVVQEPPTKTPEAACGGGAKVREGGAVAKNGGASSEGDKTKRWSIQVDSSTL